MGNLFKEFKKKAILSLGVNILYLLLKIIFLTCKKRYSDNKFLNESCIVVFWHGRLSFMSFAYLKYWNKDFNNQRSGEVIISDHKDGEIISRVIELFGIGSLRGSSSKGGAKVLIQALNKIKSGIDIIITPDGPRGPRHSVADGAIAIAQKLNKKIYILNYEASSYWEFKSWDKMILPKPFSNVYFSLSEPVDVSGLNVKDAKKKLQLTMWQESEDNFGKSVASNSDDFINNLKIWWNKNSHKNIKIDDDIKELIDGK